MWRSASGWKQSRAKPPLLAASGLHDLVAACARRGLARFHLFAFCWGLPKPPKLQPCCVISHMCKPCKCVHLHTAAKARPPVAAAPRAIHCCWISCGILDAPGVAFDRGWGGEALAQLHAIAARSAGRQLKRMDARWEETCSKEGAAFY